MSDPNATTGTPALLAPNQVDGLDLTPVDDGFIIYEKEGDRVHYLNHTAALVLLLCNGKTSVEEMIGMVQRQFELDEAPDHEVRDILVQFKDEGLIA